MTKTTLISAELYVVKCQDSFLLPLKSILGNYTVTVPWAPINFKTSLIICSFNFLAPEIYFTHKTNLTEIFMNFFNVNNFYCLFL